MSSFQPYEDFSKEPVYDVRKLPCGGWKMAKIEMEKQGRWLRFKDPKTRDFINQTVPIDYSKKYVPPRKTSHVENIEIEKNGLESIIDPFGSLKRSVLSKPINDKAAFIPAIQINPSNSSYYNQFEANNTKNKNNKTTSKPSYVEMKSSQRKSNISHENYGSMHDTYDSYEISLNNGSFTQRNQYNKSNSCISHIIQIEDDLGPQTERQIKRGIGKSCRSPFRVSNAVKEQNLKKQRPKTEIRKRNSRMNTNIRITHDSNDMIIVGSSSPAPNVYK